MLTTKSNRIRVATADAPPPKFSTTTSVIDGFRSILETDLRSVLTSVILKSCELDSLPPFIIMELLDDITFTVTFIHN